MNARLVIVLATIIAVGACAGVRTTPVGPDQLDTPVSTASINVLPPRGADWHRVTGSATPPCMVLFYKLPADAAPQPDRGHTYAASAMSSRALGAQRFADAEELAAFLSDRITATGDAGERNRLLRWRAVADTAHAPLCVRYEAEVEDRGVPGWGDTPFRVTARGYRCVHPADPSLLVDVSVSERRLADDPPWGLDEEVIPFLEGFSFRPLPETGEQAPPR